MDRLFRLFGDVEHSKLGGGDSFSDQLSCKYTVYMLALVAILSTTRVFVDEPISCYCPSEFTSSQVDFAKKVCWTHNTHFIPYDQERLPLSAEPKQYVSYYQWIPLFISFQALLFYLPRPVWRTLSRKSGIRVSDITDAGIECRHKADSDKADKIMRYMIRQMTRFLAEFAHQRRMSTNRLVSAWVHVYGNYLVIVYLSIKILYMANVIGQLFLLNIFLGTDYHLYGFDVMKRMAQGENWSTSNRFPRVTICDFHVRVLGNIHRRTVQCALPMNLFYEIMFIFLWFWFVFVATASLCSFFIWLVVSLHQPIQIDYALSRLVALERVHRTQKTKVAKFITSYMRRDGCFIVRMVAKNSSDLVAAELLAGLWDQFLQSTKSIDSIESKPDLKALGP